MTRSSYSEKLKDPRWQKKRLEVLDAAEWACEVCGDSTSQLHVHHNQYLKGREPWDYELDQLTSLCETCHGDQHDQPGRLMDVVSRLPIDGMKWIDREKAACLLAGVMGLENFALATAEQEAWFHAGLGVQDAVDQKFDELLASGDQAGESRKGN